MTTIRTTFAHIRFLGLVMLGAYILINAILEITAPFTNGWAIWELTLVAVPPMVLGMVYGIVPMAKRLGRG